MADSTVGDISKMKVVDLRKELKSRGLSYAGDKAELVSRLQAAISQDDHGDINLDSDEIDSDGVLEDEDDKSHHDILDDANDVLSEELALADQPVEVAVKPAAEPKPMRTLKRKLTADKTDTKPEDKDAASKKIVLNRNISISSTPAIIDAQKTDTNEEEKEQPKDSNKVRITAEIDPKSKLELRAKRFGLPIKMTEAERKEARKQRFGQNASLSSSLSDGKLSGSLTENLDKLKKRSERFGQSVSKIMTDIEIQEKMERRKAKFNTVK